MTIEFANRLAELRKSKGLSQEELADKLGVSRQAVSKWERGEASPDTDNLIELAKIYGISLDELVGLSNKEEKEEKSKGIHIEAGDSSIHIENPRVHLSDDDSEVHIDSDGVHIVDSEDGEVHFTKDGIRVEGEEIRKHAHVHLKNEKHGKIEKIAAALFLFSISLATIVYVTLGATVNLWGKAWVLFLVPSIISDTYKSIAYKDIDELPFNMMVTTTYLTLCVWVLNFHLWHPLWVMFLAIPLFSAVKKMVRTIRK